MKLYQNTINGLRYRQWTQGEAIAYFLKGVARDLRVFPSLFKENWLKNDGEESILILILEYVGSLQLLFSFSIMNRTKFITL
jgi:hypothetical protein